jgi:hypothetical protein
MKIRALALALTLAAGGARADGAWLSEVRDERGRVVGVVPRQNTTIAMLRETVSLVPYLQGADVLLYCNVRYTFTNPGPAAPLLVGFPEMRGRLVHHRCTYPCDPDRVTPHTVIETFAADVAGRALPVQTQPGTEDYARWFVFTVPFANGETSLRNLYVAHPGSTSVRSNTSASLDYRAEYILHTGSQWAGAIGQGDVFLWDGGLENLRHFEALRPTRDDDVQAPLHINRPRAAPSSGGTTATVVSSTPSRRAWRTPRSYSKAHRPLTRASPTSAPWPSTATRPPRGSTRARRAASASGSRSPPTAAADCGGSSFGPAKRPPGSRASAGCVWCALISKATTTARPSSNRSRSS